MKVAGKGPEGALRSFPNPSGMSETLMVTFGDSLVRFGACLRPLWERSEMVGRGLQRV
jgi:hypothetical protein